MGAGNAGGGGRCAIDASEIRELRDRPELSEKRAGPRGKCAVDVCGRGVVVGRARRIGRQKEAVTRGQGRGGKRAVDVCEVQVEAVLLVPRLLDLRGRGWEGGIGEGRGRDGRAGLGVLRRRGGGDAIERGLQRWRG